MIDSRYKQEVSKEVSQVTPPATQADHVPQFGQIPAFEHQINGKVLTDATVSGTYNLDCSLYSVFVLTMTAAADLVLTNAPTADNSKIIEIYLTGDFAPSFTGWVLMPGADPYDGTKLNRIQVDIVNDVIYYDNRTTT